MKPLRWHFVDNRELLIEWDDNHRSLYNFCDLRFLCPCAHCVDEMTGRRLINQQGLERDVRPLEITQVGHYALRFHWSDGHQTGIYGYEYLRRLCACKRCRAQTGGVETTIPPSS